MKTVLSLYALLFLVGCASTKMVMSPNKADVDRIAAKYPGYTLKQLDQGKTLFTTHCGSCHGLKNPASKSEEQWQKIVPRMAVKVNKKGEVLNADGQELILRYLVTMGSR